MVVIRLPYYYQILIPQWIFGWLSLFGKQTFLRDDLGLES